MTDALAVVNNCYIGQFVNEGHVDQLKESRERYESYEKLK